MLSLLLAFNRLIVCCDSTSGDGVVAIRINNCCDDYFDIIGVGPTQLPVPAGIWLSAFAESMSPCSRHVRVA